MAKNVYYAAMSLDGYISEPEEELTWLTEFDGPGYAGSDDAGGALDDIKRFVAGVGAIVMGSRTYEFLRKHGQWPYEERPSWVLSSRELEPMDAPDLRFASGDVADLDAEIREAAGDGDVWVLGGGDVASQYVSAGLLDIVEVTVVPVILGDGFPLFTESIAAPMRLLKVTPFDSGMTGLRYEIVK